MIDNEGVLYIIGEIGRGLGNVIEERDSFKRRVEELEARAQERDENISVWMDKCDESDRKRIKAEGALAKEKAKNRTASLPKQTSRSR